MIINLQIQSYEIMREKKWCNNYLFCEVKMIICDVHRGLVFGL
jgi:hypothetical protein